MMSSSRLVRGAKTRMFACVCFVSVLGALLYVFHGTQTRLADVQKLSNTCNQQLESLSAQLQVIFEYKLRLEKSLKKEKADHVHTKEECKNREKEERDMRDKEKTEATNKYDALLQQCKIQKSQCEDERENNDKRLANIKEEKTLLENSLQSLKQKIKDKDVAFEQLKNKYGELEQELKKQRELNEDLASKNIPNQDKLNRLHKQTIQLNAQLKTVKTSLEECNQKLGKEQEREVNNVGANENGADLLPKQDNTNALEPPRVVNLATSNSSTTPGINPDAVSNQEPSSAKPSVPDKKDELVMPTPKRSTQESAVHLQANAGPLVQPAAAGGGHNLGGSSDQDQQQLPGLIMMNPGGIQSIDQIPLPPKPASIIDPIKKPLIHQHNDNNILLGPLNPVAEVDETRGNNSPWEGGEGGQQHHEEQQDNEHHHQQQQHIQQHNNNMDANNAIEELEEQEPHNYVRPRENAEIPRQGKAHAADYHGGDYDKEPPEEEEDDEGEQMDYVQAGNNNNEQARKEEQSKQQAALHRLRHVDDSNGGGIMVNPK